MHGNVFDRVDAERNELERPRFVSHLPGPAPISAQLAADQAAHLDQRDYHLAIASSVRHHDHRPLDSKVNPNLQQGQGGNGGGSGSGGGFCNCKSPAERAYCFTHGTCNPPGGPGGGGQGGGGSGGGTSGGGGKPPVSGGGPPSWFKQWQRNQGGRGAGGGGGLLGPNALGGLKLLPNVPIGAPGSQPTSSGPSPIVVVVVLGGLAIGGYLLWHKLKLAHHQNKELDAGKEPEADAA